MLNNKKAESVAINKIVLVIIALIVLITVIVFIFRTYDKNFLLNLPDYTYPENDSIIEINESDHNVTSSICGESVGQTVEKSYSGWKYAISGFGLLDYSMKYIYIKDLNGRNKLTSLVWIKEGPDAGKIQLDKNLIFVNPTVGTVSEDGTIAIYAQWLSDDEFRSKYEKIPTKEELQMLNGAKFRGSYICREMQ